MATIYHRTIDDLPKKSLTDKCIVLDLDQTLIATADENDGMNSLYKLKILSDPRLITLRNRTYHLTIEDLENPGFGSTYQMWGVTRPHVHEFLYFCFTYFNIVAVWSAGKRSYVEAIVDYLFKDLPCPNIIFTYDDIKKDKNGDVIKPLSIMMNCNSLMKENMFSENTFALDDWDKTYQENKQNGILIPRYEPELNVKSLSKDERALLDFKDWLMQPEVIESTDVATLNKNNIFYP